MNKITTDEIRTCEECSKSYQHEPSFIFGPERDLNADLHTCPSCAPIVEGREEKERIAREDEQLRQAKEDAAKAAWLATVPPLYRETDTAHPDYPQAIHLKAIEWQKARQSGEGTPSLFLGLIGQSGRCKTRVVSQVIRQMIWKGHRCQWVNATEFQRLVQNQWSNDNGAKVRARLETFRACDVLTLDDLGKGRLTDTVAGVLYDLVEERTAQGRATLWTSNASLDDLIQMLPLDSGGPIVRRLHEFSTIIQL
jgi:DNA replication protein DnaC